MAQCRTLGRARGGRCHTSRRAEQSVLASRGRNNASHVMRPPGFTHSFTASQQRASAALLVTLSADEGLLVPCPGTVVRNTPHRACRVAFWHVSREKVARHPGRVRAQPGGRTRQHWLEALHMHPFGPAEACLEAASPTATLLLCRWRATACSELCSATFIWEGQRPEEPDNVGPFLRSAAVQRRSPGRFY